MKPTILLPQLPDVTDPVALKEYLSAHQKLLSDKQKDDYESNSRLYSGNNEMKIGYLHVREEQTSGSAGGVVTISTWVTRVLNTVKSNSITGSSLSSNTITLPAGKYRISAACPSYATMGHQTKLYNVTTSNDILNGDSDISYNGYGGYCRSMVKGEFTLTQITQIQLKQYFLQNSGSSSGLGAGVGTGNVEVFSEVEIWEVPEVLPLIPLPSETGIASQLEAQTGTDNTKTITPLSLRQGLNATGIAPIYACRAWVNFNGTGTPARTGYGNVSSITDNNTGYYTVNFTSNMEDTHYSVCVSSNVDSTRAGFANTAESLTVSSFDFRHLENSALRDTSGLFAMVFR